MQLKFTPAGRALFELNPTALTLTRFVLTDASGYTLASPPTALQGAVVYDRTEILASQVESPNTLKFTTLLDNSIGPFNFGEIGLYSGGTLVAIGVNPTLIQKVQGFGSGNGNYLRMECFLDYVNADSYGFLKLSNSDNRFQLGQVQHVDYLDPPFEGDPNVYVVNGLTGTDTPQLAFSDYFGRWNFSSRQQTYYTGAITNATSTAVDIASPHGLIFASASNYVLQFLDGPLRGYCRELVSIGGTFFQWNRPTLLVPDVGTRFLIVGPQITNLTVSGQPSIQFQDEGVSLGGAGPNVVNFVGSAVTSTRTGNTIEVSITGGSTVANLDDLANVDLAVPPSDFAVLAFDSTTSTWDARQLTHKPRPLVVETITGDTPLALGSSSHHNTVYRLISNIDLIVNIPADSAWAGTNSWSDNDYFPNSPGPMSPGESFVLGKSGVGNIVITPAPGVIINTPDTLTVSKLHGKVVLIKVGPNEFDLEGNLSP